MPVNPFVPDELILKRFREKQVKLDIFINDEAVRASDHGDDELEDEGSLNDLLVLSQHFAITY